MIIFQVPHCFLNITVTLFFSVNTHVHADHITGSGILKALLPSCQSAIAKIGGAQADVLLDDGQLLAFGEQVCVRPLIYLTIAN